MPSSFAGVSPNYRGKKPIPGFQYQKDGSTRSGAPPAQDRTDFLVATPRRQVEGLRVNLHRPLVLPPNKGRNSMACVTDADRPATSGGIVRPALPSSRPSPLARHICQDNDYPPIRRPSPSSCTWNPPDQFISSCEVPVSLNWCPPVGGMLDSGEQARHVFRVLPADEEQVANTTRGEGR